ncbi:hypothetical protein ACF06P_01095 [Streptomyces sp. NPDC015684]|uniref:hypothetical protein n=1 Tax=Streptomyces sp. NPDC015684 TaxID=3364963 RepID=UPI0036F67BE0
MTSAPALAAALTLPTDPSPGTPSPTPPPTTTAVPSTTTAPSSPTAESSLTPSTTSPTTATPSTPTTGTAPTTTASSPTTSTGTPPPTPPTSPTGTSPRPTDTSASDAETRQRRELDDVTAELDRRKADVPEELVPVVEQLAATLRAVQDPRNTPQQRNGTISSARQVDAALGVIDAPETPQAVREQLTGAVREVTSLLDAANRPGSPPEEQRTKSRLAYRASPALRTIADTGTPPEVREAVTRIVRKVRERADAGDARSMDAAKTMTASLLIISDPNTPDQERKHLARTTDEEGSSGDEQDDWTERMKKEQEEAASAQGLPDESLTKAAEVCTNAVFDSVPDGTLSRHLKSVIPDKWETEGVNDFWKSDEAANDSLDVLVQLRSRQLSGANLEIEQLVPRFADAVPAGDLFMTLGPQGLHCLRAALQLDQDKGVASGSWVRMAEEKD